MFVVVVIIVGSVIIVIKRFIFQTENLLCVKKSKCGVKIRRNCIISIIRERESAINILNEVVKDYSEQLTIIFIYIFYDRMALG